MALLRIVAGYQREDYREEVPELLYVGFDADEAERVGKEADAKYVRIELIESRRGQRLRKFAPGSPAASAGEPGPAQPGASSAVVVPSLEEVMAKGYSEDSAKVIIARCEAQLAAQIANPAMTREELEKIDAPKLARSLADLTVAELKELCSEAEIDTTGFRVKADYIAALELKAEAELAGKAAGAAPKVVTAVSDTQPQPQGDDEIEEEGGDGPRL